MWILATLICLFAAAHPIAFSAPEAFEPVDTSRLLGSPDPLPLTTEITFPHLVFERPVDLSCINDGSNRLYVAEQRGVIRSFDNHPDVKEANRFLQLTQLKRLPKGEEDFGLLGFAFHPQFPKKAEVFVNYYFDQEQSSIISRYRVSDDDFFRADPNSEERILTIKQPFANHNGGGLRFGLDGYLYIAMGDGGSFHDPYGNGQDLSTLLASILRIDVNKGINTPEVFDPS